MDIDALHSALVSLTLLPEEVRSTRETLLASGVNGAALAQFVEGIERDLRIAKAAVARDLGFRLCQCCWPPEIVAPNRDDEFICAVHLQDDPLSRVESISLRPEPIRRRSGESTPIERCQRRLAAEMRARSAMTPARVPDAGLNGVASAPTL